MSHCWEAKWNTKLDRAQRFPRSSKIQIAQSIGVPYRTFARHMQASNGYCKPTLRSGLCEYCRQFDTHEVSVTEKIMHEARLRLQAIEAGFWTEWDAIEKANVAWQQAVFIRSGDPHYWETLAAYMKEKATTVELKDFVDSFLTKFFEPDGRVDVARDIQNHWQTKENQDKEFEKLEAAPPARTWCSVSDFGEPLITEACNASVFYYLFALVSFSRHCAKMKMI